MIMSYYLILRWNKMIYLSESALKYAANICEELPRYKVGICPCRRAEIEGLMKRVQEYANDVQSVVFTSGVGRICFNNSSVIEFIPPIESNVRGRVFCLVIVNKDIDHGFLYGRLCFAEKVDYYKMIEWKKK